MLRTVAIANAWYLLMIFFTFTETYSVIKVSLPEKHGLCLPCNNSINVSWTHQDRMDIATKQGAYETIHHKHKHKHSILNNGSLCLKELERSDGGEYRCNRQLVAELEVLVGRDFSVSAGRTLLLPCQKPNRGKQRWGHRRLGQTRREHIFTFFRNFTLKRERADPQGRFGIAHGALQILNLQPGDSGEYFCNGETEAQVTVFFNPGYSTISTPSVKTDIVERKNKRKIIKKALLMVAVVGLVVVFVLTVLGILLTNNKCGRRKKYKDTEQRQKETELQPWRLCSRPKRPEAFRSLCPEEETDLHYASLGRRNWMDRPRTQMDENHVIYADIVTRPAVM